MRHLTAHASRKFTNSPIPQVRDELGWAVRFDLSASVFCMLACGAPHGVAVLSPWSAAPSTCQRNARDFSMPLGYYVVMRGWRIPSIVDGVLAKGWTELQASQTKHSVGRGRGCRGRHSRYVQGGRGCCIAAMGLIRSRSLCAGGGGERRHRAHHRPHR